MSNRNISPKTVTKRGPGSNAVDITIDFTTSAAHPDGSILDLDLNSSWAFTAESTCTVSGVSNDANGNAPTVTGPTGVGYTLTGFGAVGSSASISISCTNVLVSDSSSATTDLVATLTTTDSAGNEINDWGTNTVTEKVTIDSNNGTLATSSSVVMNVMPTA